MENLNYKMGWIVVYFDLPTKSKKDKKNYVNFRKALLEDGYLMIQFSVYARPCVSHDRMQTHSRRLKAFLPPAGAVRCMYVTNIQWENTIVFYGPDEQDPIPKTLPQQMLLW